jgi:DNA-binding NtrC family response regulator
MVRSGSFREDLAFRIRVMTLELPPLRRYKDNLEVLAAVFVQQAAQRHGRRVVGIAPAAMALLRAYDYPGNVRELRNLLEHAVIMSDREEIQPGDLPDTVHAQAPTPAGGKVAAAAGAAGAAPKRKTLEALRDEWLAPKERQYLSDLLEACAGNVREASRRAGVTPVTLYRLMARRGVKLTRAPRLES